MNDEIETLEAEAIADVDVGATLPEGPTESEGGAEEVTLPETQEGETEAA